MEVFKIIVVSDDFDSLGIPDDAVDDSAELFELLNAEEAVLDRWIPPTVQFFSDGGRCMHDFYDFTDGKCVSARCAAAFTMVEGLELLPLGDVNDLPGYCQNDDPFGFVIHFTDRVKLHDDSIVTFFPATDSIQTIEKLVVLRESILKRPIFQVAGDPVTLFCTDQFRNDVESRSLTGVEFADIPHELR